MKLTLSIDFELPCEDWPAVDTRMHLELLASMAGDQIERWWQTPAVVVQVVVDGEDLPGSAVVWRPGDSFG